MLAKLVLNNTEDTLRLDGGSQSVPHERRVQIVVPCFNEASRLDQAAFLAALANQPELDLLFVDDGSTDNTLLKLQKLQAMAPARIRVASMGKNSGKAEAVRAGLEKAAASGSGFVGYWDADLATPLNAVEDMVRVAQRLDGVDVVLGSRRGLMGHRVERTIGRRAISRICNLMARTALAMPVGDTQCGAKLFRNSANLSQAIREPFTLGWLFDVELLARLKGGTSKNGIFEMPLMEWNEVPGSKIRPLAVIKAGFQMLGLIVRNRLLGRS